VLIHVIHFASPVSWGQKYGLSVVQYILFLARFTQQDRLNEFVNLFYFTYYLFYFGGHTVAQWLRHYATNRKVAGSIPDEVGFLNYLIFSAALGPGVYLACNRNECRKHKHNNVSEELSAAGE
jgi:hypothetical protein